MAIRQRCSDRGRSALTGPSRHPSTPGEAEFAGYSSALDYLNHEDPGELTSRTDASTTVPEIVEVVQRAYARAQSWCYRTFVSQSSSFSATN